MCTIRKVNVFEVANLLLSPENIFAAERLMMVKIVSSAILIIEDFHLNAQKPFR